MGWNLKGLEMYSVKDKYIDAFIVFLINFVLDARDEARQNKNYELSDSIRAEFLKVGIKIGDI